MMPFEALAIATLEFIGKVIDGQPPEVKKQMWIWYVEDVKIWREFWKPKP